MENKEEKERFVFEIINIHCQFFVTGCAAESVKGYAAWKATASVADLIITGKLGNMLCKTIGEAPWKVTWAAEEEIAKEIAKNMTKDAPFQEVVEACCQMTIGRRKQIMAKILQVVDKMIAKDFEPCEIIECLKLLVTFTEKNLNHLTQMIPQQQCKYLLFVERLIWTTNNLFLLEDHRTLVKQLELTKMYTSLFPPVIGVTTHLTEKTLPLPTVLIELIVNYCQFSWYQEENLDEIFNRLFSAVVK